MGHTITLQTSLRTSAPRLAGPIGRAAAALLGRIQTWTRPQPHSASHAAAHLRRLANQYDAQPSFAADLRAAADRHEQINGID